MPDPKPEPSRFKAGFIFPPEKLARESGAARSSLRKFAEDERYAATDGGWEVWDTSIRLYSPLFDHHWTKCGHLSAHADFEDYLKEKFGQAELRKEKFRILDVGMGSGSNWLPLLAQHPELELLGTALTLVWTVPELKNLVIACNASELHRNFAPGSFDMVVSNYGFHANESSVLENAHFVLKAGGELFLSTDLNLTRAYGESNIRDFFEILAMEKPNSNWGCHLVKK